MLSCVDTGKKSLHKIIEAIEYVSHKRFVYFYDHSLASIHNLTSIASNAFLAVSCLFNAFIWSIHKFFVVYCHLSHGHVKQCFVDLLFEFSISSYDSCYLTTAIFFSIKNFQYIYDIVFWILKYNTVRCYQMIKRGLCMINMVKLELRAQWADHQMLTRYCIYCTFIL